MRYPSPRFTAACHYWLAYNKTSGLSVATLNTSSATTCKLRDDKAYYVIDIHSRWRDKDHLSLIDMLGTLDKDLT
jgi:hypothetical protein